MIMSRIFVGIMLFLALSGIASGQSIGIVPNPKVTPLNQNFTVNPYLETPTQIRGCMVKLTYDPAKLTYVTASKGALFSAYSSVWWQSVQETPNTRRIECIIMGAGLYVTGPGNMLNVTFTAIAGEYAKIEISEWEIYEPVDGLVIPGVTATGGDVIIGTSPAYGKVRCFLQGPYSNGSMNLALNPSIPLISPYSADPASVPSMPTDIVDWVLLEFRSTSNGQPVLSKSMLLDANGYLRMPDKPYFIMLDFSTGPYFVVFRHRNHLSVMSANSFQLASSGTPPMLDLTTLASIYGNGGVIEVDFGVVAPAAGDADQNGSVLPSDRNMHWRIQSGLSGYRSADFNLDGNVMPSDLNGYWRLNSGLSGTVPVSR